MNYIIKSLYGDLFCYKINLDMKQKLVCKVCAENIIPFVCDNYKVEAEVRYVDIEKFEEQAKEIGEIKIFLSKWNNEYIQPVNQIIKENIPPDNQFTYNTLSHNENLETEIKDKVINLLTQNLSVIIENNKQNILNIHRNQNEWQSVNKTPTTTIPRDHNRSIPLANRFCEMSTGEDVINNDDAEAAETRCQRNATNNLSTIINSAIIKKNANKGQVFINETV